MTTLWQIGGVGKPASLGTGEIDVQEARTYVVTGKSAVAIAAHEHRVFIIVRP